MFFQLLVHPMHCRFTSNRFQVVDFWSNFWVFRSAVFGAYLSK